LVEFYAPWCGHCKKLAPEYAQAAISLKGVASIAKVDADAEQNRPLASRFGIRGFPTIKLFRNGVPTDYEGGRSANEIVAFMKKQSLPAVSELESADEVNSFSNEERVVIIGFFNDGDSKEYRDFFAVAEKLRNNFLFGAVLDKEAVNKEYQVKEIPTILLFKKFDEGKNTLPSSSFEKLEEFIFANSVPLIDEIGPHNYKAYSEAKIPLVYLFVDLATEGQKDIYVELVRPVAQESKGKLNWVYIDWSKFAKHSERLGLSGKTVPALAIEQLEQGTHYAFDESAEITGSTVQAWIKSFLNGQLQPTIKSEEIPTDNNGPVTIIVAKTFDQIVNDPAKDVLVEFYAPWCGHCKQLAPIYEEVGTELKNIPSVVIAKIDATANDVSPNLEIRGFPTLKLFPANNKQAPVDYDGDRTKEDLIHFIEENGSVKFKLTGKDEL